ncbi:hypothetical protein N9R79_00890 [Vibrio sp.]|nr:hypothetical protein [Vibrio sp.]
MVGILFIVASVTLQAFVLSKISYQFSSAEVMTFSVFSFLLCTLIFGLKLLLKGQINITKKKGMNITILNIHTLLAFGSFHLALIFLPASSAALFETSIALLAIALLTKEIPNRILQTCVIIAFTLGFILAANAFSVELIQGAILSALAGVGAATISVRSNHEHNKVLSTDEALAYRFILSGVVVLSALYFSGSGLQFSVSYIEVVLLSLFGFVLPFYLLQKGMAVTKPVLTISMLSVIPVVSYLFESVFYASTSLIELTLMSCSIILIILYSCRGLINEAQSNTKAKAECA